jgi:hypothetical protein
MKSSAEQSTGETDLDFSALLQYDADTILENWRIIEEQQEEEKKRKEREEVETRK